MNDVQAARGVRDGVLLIPRREFLILGSAAAVGVAVAGNAGAQWTQKAIDSADPLSIGFAEGSFAEIRAAEGPRALANATRHGNTNHLGDVARVKVHGIVSAEAAPAAAAIALDAIYRVPGVAEAVPFHAWSSRVPPRVGSSSANQFLMGVSPASPLTLALTTQQATTWRTSLARRFFGTPASPAVSRAVATLRRNGVYFIAVPAAGQSEPNWASIRVVAPANGNLPQLEQSSLLGSKPVSFDYIVVAAERA